MANFTDYVEFMRMDGIFPIVGIKVNGNTVEEGLLDSLDVYKALHKIGSVEKFTEKEIKIMNALKEWGKSISEVTEMKDNDEWKEYENWFRENLLRLEVNKKAEPLKNNPVQPKVMKIREKYEIFKKLLKENGYIE